MFVFKGVLYLQTLKEKLVYAILGSKGPQPICVCNLKVIFISDRMTIAYIINFNPFLKIIM